MCYTDAKKKEILNAATNATEKEVLKTVAAEWRALSDRDRANWDEVARNDKVRYVALPSPAMYWSSATSYSPHLSLTADLFAKRRITKDHGTFQSAARKSIP